MGRSDENQVTFGWAASEANGNVRVPRRPSRPVPAASPWLTAQQAAEYLSLPSVRALYKRIERASVPPDAVRRWGRQFRFKREALDALMGRHG